MQMFSAQALVPEMKEECINLIFDRFGPTPRLCLDYGHNEARLQNYEDKVQETISGLTIEQLETWFKDSRSLSMTANSHKICLINRKSDLPGQTVVTIITQFIEKRLANQNRTMERDDQIRLYKRLADLPQSRRLADVVFKAAGQRQLQDGIELDIMEMVRLGKSHQGSLPQWHSGHIALANKSLNKLRKRAQHFKINIPDPKMVEYGEKGPSSITANVLYLPKLTNQVALDSFILFENFFYIFQFTIGKQHDIKPGLVDWYERCSGVPPITRWRFVFVIGPNQYLTCPQPRLLNLHQLQPFSAVMILQVVSHLTPLLTRSEADISTLEIDYSDRKVQEQQVRRNFLKGSCQGKEKICHKLQENKGGKDCQEEIETAKAGEEGYKGQGKSKVKTSIINKTNYIYNFYECPFT